MPTSPPNHRCATSWAEIITAKSSSGSASRASRSSPTSIRPGTEAARKGTSRQRHDVVLPVRASARLSPAARSARTSPGRDLAEAREAAGRVIGQACPPIAGQRPPCGREATAARRASGATARTRRRRRGAGPRRRRTPAASAVPGRTARCRPPRERAGRPPRRWRRSSSLRARAASASAGRAGRAGRSSRTGRARRSGTRTRAGSRRRPTALRTGSGPVGNLGLDGVHVVCRQPCHGQAAIDDRAERRPVEHRRCCRGPGPSGSRGWTRRPVARSGNRIAVRDCAGVAVRSMETS